MVGELSAGSERELSFGSYLRALRYASAGSRIDLGRRLFPYLFKIITGTTGETCEFDSLKNYEKIYRRLAQLLGRNEKVPPLDEVEFLDSIQDRCGRPGTIGLADTLFLTSVASLLAPERALEVGTLAGFSAAIIAAALHRQHPSRTGVLVHTIDRYDQNVVEPEKPVGFQIPDIIPDFPEAVQVHAPADSRIICELARRDEVGMAFVDADHRHPQPLLDLVRLAPYMKSGGWIVFHDIQWGTIGRKAREAGQTLRWPASYGAEWLFASWPFRKIAGGNIGAVQIPDDKLAIVPFALRLMRLPLEVRGKDARHVPQALYRSLSDMV